MYSVLYLASLLAFLCTVWAAVLVDSGIEAVTRPVLERDEPSSCLAVDVRQNASSLTGQEKGNEGIKDGQSPSAM